MGLKPWANKKIDQFSDMVTPYWSRRYEARKKATGRCMYCGRPAFGKKRCPKCIAQKKLYQRKLRARDKYVALYEEDKAQMRQRYAHYRALGVSVAEAKKLANRKEIVDISNMPIDGPPAAETVRPVSRRLPLPRFGRILPNDYPT